jgi:hypothetical protein
MPRQIVIAYWLIPSEPAHSYLQGFINQLAQRYNAPVFEPHVTVHAGVNCADAVDEVLSNASQWCKQIVLRALEVSDSSEFIKTLFCSSLRPQNCRSSIKAYVPRRKIRLTTSSIRT